MSKNINIRSLKNVASGKKSERKSLIIKGKFSLQRLEKRKEIPYFLCGKKHLITWSKGSPCLTRRSKGVYNITKCPLYSSSTILFY